MYYTKAPDKWLPALLFIVIAAALSAYVSYYVTERLKTKANAST